MANNNNLANHPNAAQLQALQLAQSLQLASPLLSQQLLPSQLFGNGLPGVAPSNTSTLLQQMQLQQHILQLRQNQQAAAATMSAATNRERNSSSSSNGIWRLADLANGEPRSQQDHQSDDDTPESKRRKVDEGGDCPEE